MSIDALKDALPEHAKDLKLNLSSLAGEGLLTADQRAGCFLVAAIAAREPRTLAALAAYARAILSPDAFEAARTVAALMAMNNVYYRFAHLVSAPDYKTLPAKLRMNGLARPGAAKADMELWALAVSAVNGCGMCLDAHEKELRKAGLAAEQVQAAARIAATVHAVAVTLEAGTVAGVEMAEAA